MGVPQEFLEHAIPDYLGAQTSFPLDCQVKKNDNNQHSNSHLLSMNQNFTYFFVRLAKVYFIVPWKFSNCFMCAMR